MSKIFITGISGVLGTALYRELLGRGHQVSGCDLFHSHDPRITRADVADYTQLKSAFSVEDFDANGDMRGSFPPDIVYHLAGEFGRLNSDHFPVELWRTNCIGTHNVIRACLYYRSRLVFASSSEAYGNLADYSNLEESLLDTTVPRFHNEYALTKFTNEKQIEIGIDNGLKAVVLRFFNAYGPGEHYSPYRSVVCLFAYRMLHNLPITVYRDYRRVFMYIDDWARTVANVANPGVFDSLPNGAAFNIAGEESRTVEELAGLIQGLTGSRSLINYQDKESANVTDKRPDISKARALLDHKPTVTLERGVPLTLDWMRKLYNVHGNKN